MLCKFLHLPESVTLLQDLQFQTTQVQEKPRTSEESNEIHLKMEAESFRFSYYIQLRFQAVPPAKRHRYNHIKPAENSHRYYTEWNLLQSVFLLGAIKSQEHPKYSVKSRNSPLSLLQYSKETRIIPVKLRIVKCIALAFSFPLLLFQTLCRKNEVQRKTLDSVSKISYILFLFCSVFCNSQIIYVIRNIG